MREYPRVTGPPTYGASGEDVGPYPEETLTGFELRINLRGWAIEQRRTRRLRELGLL